MFINDVHRKEEIRHIAVQHLRKYGIKHRPKKSRPHTQGQKYGRKFFKVPLQTLETETVTLTNGQQLLIPKRIHEMCSFILGKVQTEGIFRKEGSKARQHEIKLSLDRGSPLGDKHHVIDVAVVLKCFLRELPEPLIPPAYNDLFLLCSLEKRPREVILECILLVCLLLPGENLNVLSYLMQFFHEVAGFSKFNKMGISNLSILVGPNIFPMDDKLAPKSSLTITRICDITRLLIENSRSIGVIPEYIIDQIGQLTDMENEKRRKNKRRSGSLTRMLNSLKKMVGNKTDEDSSSSYTVTPDLLLTPTVHTSIKKKKGEGGLSLKKKKEVLTKLPDCALLNDPFTPSRTPVSINPNGKKNVEEAESKEKKMHWYMRSRSMKSLKEDDSMTNTQRNSLGPKSLLERRWSAVSNVANLRKKKRASCAVTSKTKQEEPDYVRVSKTEYEDFKNRVSEIERRISLELDNVQGQDDRDANIENVQTAYQKTLEAASLSPTTDHLARRLSRELKIRRSAEQKIIRSPSARKIGTIRRRSTEREKKGQAQVVRNQSWHLGPQAAAPLLPRVNMRRMKRISNEDMDLQKNNCEQKTKNGLTKRISNSPCVFTIESSFMRQVSPRCPSAEELSESGAGLGTSCSTYNLSGTPNEHWASAEGFFCASKTLEDDGASGDARASIAKLRSQNVGMVRAKAKLFDSLKDSDTSCSSVASSSTRSQPGSARRPTKSGSRSGSVRSTESARMSHRIKALKLEDQRSKKGSLSPRRKHVTMTQKQKLQYVGRQFVRCSKEIGTMDVSQDSELSTPHKVLNMVNATTLSPRRTPRAYKVPYIKGPLAVRTPKRLCRTPNVDRKTPLRAVATPI